MSEKLTLVLQKLQKSFEELSLQQAEEKAKKEQALEKDYQKFGSVWIQDGLLKSITQDDWGETIITLSDGTCIDFNRKDYNPNSNINPTTISKHKDGAIIFDNFNKQWASIIGTDKDNAYIIKNSSKISVYPAKGNDTVILDNSTDTDVVLNDNDNHDTVVLYGKNLNSSIITNAQGTSRTIQGDESTTFHFWGTKEATQKSDGQAEKLKDTIEKVRVRGLIKDEKLLKTKILNMKEETQNKGEISGDNKNDTITEDFNSVNCFK